MVPIAAKQGHVGSAPALAWLTLTPDDRYSTTTRTAAKFWIKP
jgi:hypothetical protein